MKEKIDLRDVTFNIPVRYDTDDRKNNLDCVLKYLQTNFDTNIIILECDKEPIMYSGIKNKLTGNVLYNFIAEDTPIFHRTRFLNVMAGMSQTPVIVNYDADVILRTQQYVVARNAVLDGTLDACTAFSSYTMNVPKKYIQTINETGNVDWLSEMMCHIPHRSAVAKGGVVFWNKKKFIEVGMENENFISWGPEDQERVERCLKLGYKWGRVNGPLYHLDHQRLLNSGDSHEYSNHNDEEFKKILRMDDIQLKEYVKGFEWLKNYV